MSSTYFNSKGWRADIAIPADELKAIDERIAKNYRVTTAKFIRSSANDDDPEKGDADKKKEAPKDEGERGEQDDAAK